MSLMENISKNLNNDQKQVIINNAILSLLKIKNNDYLDYSEKKFQDSIDYILNKLGGNIK